MGVKQFLSAMGYGGLVLCSLFVLFVLVGVGVNGYMHIVEGNMAVLVFEICFTGVVWLNSMRLLFKELASYKKKKEDSRYAW